MMGGTLGGVRSVLVYDLESMPAPGGMNRR